MSPFVHKLSSKHGRQLLSPHVRYVEEVQNFQRRTNTFQTSKESFDDIINKWWVAFALGGLALMMLLVVAVVGLFRCVRRRKSKPLTPESDINDKKTRNEKATPPPFGSTLFSPPPRIMITPATASPTKLRFSLGTDETLVDLADYLKCGDKLTGPELRPDLHRLEYQESSDSPVECDFDGSETDIAHVQIAHVQTTQHSRARQFPLYHSEDPSHIRNHDWEDETFDEIDLHSPGAPARRAGSSGADTPVKQFTHRAATTLVEKSAQSRLIGQVNLDSDPETVSGSGASEPGLTEAELGTLMLQFPPPAYSKTSVPMHQTGGKTLPLRPETELHDDPYTRHAIRYFAFHRPTAWQNRSVSPHSPNRGANLHTASSPTIPQLRSKHSSTTSQARSRPQAHAMINIRDRPVSDRYAARYLATETATAPWWSEPHRDPKGRKEEEMRDIA